MVCKDISFQTPLCWVFMLNFRGGRRVGVRIKESRYRLGGFSLEHHQRHTMLPTLGLFAGFTFKDHINAHIHPVSVGCKSRTSVMAFLCH